MLPTDYWQSRKHLRYYQRVREILNASPGDSILDVGSGGTPVATWGDFEHRHSISLHDNSEPPPVGDHVTADFLTWEPQRTYDVVTCLQVLEHVKDPRPFAQKLLQVFGNKLIVSVPWHWPADICEHHCQDPVDTQKMEQWFGQLPDPEIAVDSGRERAIFILEK